MHRKSAILLQRGQFDPKFQVEGVTPPIIFYGYHGNKYLTTLPLTVFTHKLSSTEVDFGRKSAILLFEPPLGA